MGNICFAAFYSHSQREREKRSSFCSCCLQIAIAHLRFMRFPRLGTSFLCQLAEGAMGCGNSKIETESAVKHCRARKQYMKQAVSHRHAFAAAHASYANSLKSAGAAIWQMADVEATPEGAPQPAPASIAVRNTVTNLLPPPHPPDDAFSGGPRTPLPRAASMPPIPIKSLGASPPKRSFPQGLSEDNEELYANQGFAVHKPTHSETLFDPFDNYTGPGTSTFDTEDFELKLPEAEDDEVEEETFDDNHYRAQIPMPQGRRSDGDTITLGRETRKQPQVPPPQQKVGKADLNFGAVIYALDGLFLKSYEAAGEVSRLLEAKRDYHHAPFVDETHGIEDHNMKVSKILTWNQSNLANDDATGAHNLASTLDRLHAWEKKLYDEVKTAEATRLELTRRSAQLRNPRGGHEASSTFAKTKALVKSLNTRYLVEIEAMDAAYAEIKKLRDESLYPQMMSLLEALKKMWKVMHDCHQSQVPLINELSNLPTPSTQATSEICIKFTVDLEREVTFWQESLEKMVRFQKSSANSLLEWLHLNAKQIDSEAVDYLPASQKEDIALYEVCRAWTDVVNQLSAESVLHHLNVFSSILKDVANKQADEIKQKKIKEDLYRDLEKKTKAFEAFVSKYKEKAASKGAPQGSLESARHPIQERRALVELLQKTVAEEEQRHARLCEENSTMIFESLKLGLPDVVHSIEEFSRSCAKEYGQLHDRLTSRKMASEVRPS